MPLQWLAKDGELDILHPNTERVTCKSCRCSDKLALLTFHFSHLYAPTNQEQLETIKTIVSAGVQYCLN
jgi:hypothetical protein